MIYDLSIPISPDMPVYPGDPSAEVTPASRISQGAGANVSILRFGSHTGTHVDPPFHFIEGGATVDELPLDVLVGECLVHKVESPVIRIEDLEGIPQGTERIIFKTGNSDLWRAAGASTPIRRGKPGFQTDYTYLDPDAAEWLIKLGIRLVGIDYLSIEKLKSGTHPTHTRLLQAGVVIVEGLDCSGVPEGMYTLVCLPLKIKGGDGAPARAILMK